jgi:hypothetical protein
MATITGITAERADDILGQSVVSGSLDASGHLILTRNDGTSFDAGDFTAIVTDIMDDRIAAQLDTRVPDAIAGTTVNKGNQAGVISFSTFTSANLPNAMIRLVATGNITVDVAQLPSTPKPNTQFAMKIQQDATGGRTLTLTGFKKSQGTLALTTTPNAIDIVVFLYDGVQWYAGMMGVDFK